MLISFAVTAKLICTFVFAYNCEADQGLCFAYADCWFSHGVAQFFTGTRLSNQVDFHYMVSGIDFWTSLDKLKYGASLIYLHDSKFENKI